MELDSKSASSGDVKAAEQDKGASSSCSSQSSSQAAACLSLVSSDVLASILTFLFPSDLCRFFPCSRFCSSFQHHETLWTSLLASIYRINRSASASPAPLQLLSRITAAAPASTSASRLFRLQYAEFPPRYFPHYSSVHSLCRDMLLFLHLSAPQILSSLQTGVSEEAVRQAEQAARRAGLRLPLDWLLFLKFFNGQQLNGRRNQRDYSFHGLFGTVRFYHTIGNLRLRPLGDVMRDAAASAASLIPVTSSTIGSLFTNGNENLESQLCFFLDSRGRVVRRFAGRQLAGRRLQLHVVADSFSAFVAEHLRRLRAGLYAVKPVVQQLRARDMEVGGISRFAFPDPCGSDCVTAGIRVQAAVLCVPEESDSPEPGRDFHIFFTYRIRISHTGQSSIDATLTTRRWSIVNDRGEEQVVEGEGVIGYHPHMYPGCQPFEYESVSVMDNSCTGSMGGSFNFQLANRDELIEVTVAPFRLDLQHNFN